MKAVVTAILAALLAPLALFAGDVADAAPAGDDEVIAFVVRGVGNGHGRGMSQWGAYGRSVAGQSWQEILGSYYGGTVAGSRSEPHMRVRLTDWDGAGTLGVVSRTGTARWNDSATGYTSLYATETSTNVFSVYGVASELGCPGGLDLTIPFVDLQDGSLGSAVVQLQQFLDYFGFDPGDVDGEFGPLTRAAVVRFQDSDPTLTADGLWRTEEATAAQALVDAQGGSVAWQELATGVAGPIRFSSTVDQSAASAGDVLGVCEASGAVTHYRGDIELVDVGGTNRVVNDVDVENYVRGVLPKEVPPSWGDAAGGAGMNSLRAQAVAARSFGISQSRYSYAGTCDTPSCQVYAGSAIRVSATTGNFVRVEHALTDQAIVETAGTVRVWPATSKIVSTEFSASNGPRTAGGAFPPVDDPWDDVPGNPHHRWVRIIDADAVRSRYGLDSANGVTTAPDADSPYEGIWANEVRLGNGETVSAWDFRNAFGLRAPGFELIPVRRSISHGADFAFVGDSVGVSVAGTPTSNFPVLTEGVFSDVSIDVLGGRRTQGGAANDGVVAASNVPVGTDVVLVELGYNDTPAAMPERIDAVMTELRSRSVGLVVWVTVSERLSYYTATNEAINDAATRWDEMIVIDWHAASDHGVADRWYSDDVHLTATGRAEFALWLRDTLVAIASDGYTPPRPVVPGHPLRVPVLGVGGVPESGVVGVALNVTSVRSVGPGFLRVWPCGSVEPGTSSVNFVAAGSVEPNAVVVPVDGSGEVCVSSLVATDVLVDVTGWFDSGLQAAMGRLVDTRGGDRVVPGEVLRVPVLGVGGVPESGVVGVALNVTSVRSVGPGFLRVWPCGSVEPGTSSVNFVAAGSVEPNAVVVPVDGSGEVCVSSLVATDVLVDVTGWFDSGLQAAMGRLVDTRGGDRVVPGEVLRVPVLGVGGVPESGVVGVALNVTSVRSVGPGFLRVWPCGSVEPGTSSVNFVAAGSVEPNAVVVPVDGSGEVCVSSLVATDVLVDVTGWFDSGLRGSPGTRLVDTRIGQGPIPPR